jgi:hypothetical protein
MHCLGYVLEIVGNVERNTFVVLPGICWNNSSPKYGVLCTFRQISSVTALVTDSYCQITFEL